MKNYITSPQPLRVDGPTSAVAPMTLVDAKRSARDLKHRLAVVTQLAADAFHATYGGDVVATIMGTVGGVTNTGATMKFHAPAVGSTATIKEATDAYAALMTEFFGEMAGRLAVVTESDDAGFFYGRLDSNPDDVRPLPFPFMLIIREKIEAYPKRCRAAIPARSASILSGGAR